MATDTQFGFVRFFDDFTDDAINTNNWSVTDMTGGTNFAINVQVNGVLRGIAHTSADQGVILLGELNWQADDGGPLIFECRMKPEANTGALYYMGFSDAKTQEQAMDYNGGSLTTAATDAVGFYYAGSESSPTWRCGGVKNGTDSTQTAASSNFNPATGTWQTFRIVLDENGDGSFYIDGNIIVEGVEDCVTVDTSLLQTVGVWMDATSVPQMDIDYIYVSKGRV